MLGNDKHMAFIAVSDPDRAKAFYADRLGLRLLEDARPFAVVFDLHGTMLRAQIMGERFTPANYTALGWEVPDIAAKVREMQAAGIAFERFGGGMQQDELGIWSAPSGARVAWFKDPDGNFLSLTQL